MRSVTRRECVRNIGLGILCLGAVSGLKNSEATSAAQFPVSTPNMPSDPAKTKKFVVMSDLHFGVRDCILNKKETGNIQRLIGKIEKQKPEELILLGDIFDFSLCSLYETCNNARGFFGELKKLDGLKVTYIPGNHDHHIWTYIIESEYFIKPLTEGRDPEVMDLYLKNVVSTGPFTVPFLNHFYQGLEVVYPHAIRKCGGRSYYFTHGHLQDDIFTIGSDMRRPENLAELEAFNCWWIEGGWFYMGQAGKLSEKIRDIYEKETWLKFTDAFGFGARAFLNGLWRRLGWKKFFRVEAEEEPVAVRAVKPGYIADHIERFVQAPLPITFVYGHTHLKNEESLQVLGHDCTVLNTGTWIKKNEEDKKNNGFLVIDEKENRWVPFWEE